MAINQEICIPYEKPLGLSREGSPGGMNSYETECQRLRTLLAGQMESNALREARETAVALLCLNPADPDGLQARAFLEDQLAQAASHPPGAVRRFEGHRQAITTVAISPDGTRVLSGSGKTGMGAEMKSGEDPSLRLWDLAGGGELLRFLGHSTMVSSAVFSADGHHVLSAARGGSMYLWDARTTQPVQRFGNGKNQLRSVALSPCGRWALSGGEDRKIRLWNVKTGARCARLEGHTAAVSSLAFSPQGHQVLSGGFDNTIRLWDLAGGREVRRLRGHQLPVLSVAISPDGRWALSAGWESILRLWDLESGTERRQFPGHRGQVNSVVFSPDGLFALSGGSDNTLRLWDLATGRELHRFLGHTEPVSSVAFTPDGSHVLSGSQDRTVRLWQVPHVMVNSPVAKERSSSLEMPYGSVSEFIEVLRNKQLLTPAQWAEVENNLQGLFKTAPALALHLRERGWLTPYQVEQLTQRVGQELTLGTYVLLDRLGEGGMGAVFKAKRQDLDQVVALKVVRPDLVSHTPTAEQFLGEIRALARLSHPNIIRTFGGYQVGNRHFYVMEFLEGTDLAKLVQQSGPLPVAQACEYIRQAALGLEHAHEHCLVHRDIKPANLLLTLPQGRLDRGMVLGTVRGSSEKKAVIKIIDWGLASLRLPAGHQPAGTPPEREEMVGTADYLAPEQALDARTTTIQADIYSLGCTLYHLLAGRPPFSGRSVVQLILKHQQEKPPSVQSLRPEVPAALAAILQKMMNKRPEDRFGTPAAVAAALAPFCRNS
ncbi:MAG: protein kinase [Planctomycetes bacterium]|nr:protein kinase [Planctomycetota bacterium]